MSKNQPSVSEDSFKQRLEMLPEEPFLRSGILTSEIQQIRQHKDTGEIFLMSRISERIYKDRLDSERVDLLISGSEKFDIVECGLPDDLEFEIGDRVQQPDLVRGEALSYYEVPGFDLAFVEVGGDGTSNHLRLQRTFYYYPPSSLELHRKKRRQ